MIPKWFSEIRGRVPSGISVLLGIIPLVVLVLLWAFLTRGIPEERFFGPTILPSPAEVIQSFGDLVRSSDTCSITSASVCGAWRWAFF